MTENMISGKTSIGFEYLIDRRRLSDLKVMRIIAGMYEDGVTDGKLTKLTLDYAEAILGKEQMDALEKAIREANDGFCSGEDFENQITEIQGQIKEIKN